MTKQSQIAVWNEYSTAATHESDKWASTDRGWLKALTGPWKYEDASQYTHETMPVPDEDVPGGWREQSTLGNYLDYGPDHYRSAEDRAKQPGNVHCVCYPSHTYGYVETVEQARAWIESEAKRVRPELTYQDSLTFAEVL